MAISSFTDVRKQLTFYGAYHNNPINVLIHVICVPLLMWSFIVFTSGIPLPVSLPDVHYKINDYLVFDLNTPAILAILYETYYLALDPIAGLLYAPQFMLWLLSGTAFSYRPGGVSTAVGLHIVSWIAQFLGHGVAEGRAPALLDNLLGAVVLAPFFVHLELLFMIGYRPQLHRDVKNGVGAEILKIKRAEAEKKRQTQRKDL